MSSETTKKLAIRGITLLQEAIERDFGLKVKMGAELEFMAYPLEPDPHQNNTNPLNLSYQGKLADHPKVLFRHSHLISNEYKEDPTYQYELVFHHDNNHDSPVVLGRAIEAAKKQILDRAHSYNVTTSLEGVSSQSMGTASWKPTNGLHINISLENEEGVNIFEVSPLSASNLSETDNQIKKARILGNALVNEMLSLQSECVLLHAPRPASYDRFSSQNDRSRSPKLIANDDAQSITFKHYIRYDTLKDGSYRDIHGNARNVVDNPVTPHIENRLAGADADPYQVILATMAAMYAALGAQLSIRLKDDDVDTTQKVNKAVCRPIPETLDEAVNEFTQGRRLKDTLNTLSGNEKLGDRFCEAVLEDAKVAHLQPKLESRGR